MEKDKSFVKKNKRNYKSSRRKSMYKELTISFIIVIAIIIGNTITQNYTEQTVTELSENLNQLRENFIQEDETVDWEKAQQELEEIEKIWKIRYEKMAYYIEHNELEKVESNLTGLKSYTQKEDAPEALNQLDNSIFILKHIEEKNALNLKNVF